MQNDGPDQAKGQLRVAVDDVLSPDVDQLDLLVAEEVERHLHVLQHVEPHAASFARLECAGMGISDGFCIELN